MKNLKILILILFDITIYGQVGINTVNPQDTFHIDGGKDNPAIGTPTVNQQVNDFIVTSSGAVGIGTAGPSSKLEINSNESGISGLKFTQLTSSSPVGTGQIIGVDATGNVINVAQTIATADFSPGLPGTSGTNFTVGDTGWVLVSGTTQTITVPTGGKAVFVNFMLGIDYLSNPSGSGFGFYTAALFIDPSSLLNNTPTNVPTPSSVYLTTQEPGSGGLQAQFSLSTVIFLTAGTHILQMGMKRTTNNGTTSGQNMTCKPISIYFNASYLN